jgi:hypothetical protein
MRPRPIEEGVKSRGILKYLLQINHGLSEFIRRWPRACFIQELHDRLHASNEVVELTVIIQAEKTECFSSYQIGIRVVD